MNKTLQNFFAFGTNWLRRIGFNKLAFWLSEKLYNSINIDKIYGEVYEDCHDMMAETMPDIDQKWGWMQKEHVQYLFGGLTVGEMRAEAAQLARTFEELLPKKHPVAMVTMEAFKAGYRDEKIQRMLKQVLSRLQIPQADGVVLFDNDKERIVINPKFKEVHYTEKMDVPHEKKKEAENLVRLVVGGSTVDWMTKMMEQRANMVQATSFKPIIGHRNDSFCPIRFGVWNCGEASLDSCTVIFDFPDFVELKMDNEERTYFPKIHNPKSNTWVYEDEHQVQFNAGDLTLGLGRRSTPFFVRVPRDVKEVEVNWSLSCKTLKKYGKLTIVNIPEVIPEYEEVKFVPAENPSIKDMVVALTD